MGRNLLSRRQWQCRLSKKKEFLMRDASATAGECWHCGLGVTVLAACGTATGTAATEPEAKEEMKEEKQAEAAPVTEEVTLRYYSWFSERDQGGTWKA